MKLGDVSIKILNEDGTTKKDQKPSEGRTNHSYLLTRKVKYPVTINKGLEHLKACLKKFSQGRSSYSEQFPNSVNYNQLINTSSVLVLILVVSNSSIGPTFGIAAAADDGSSLILLLIGSYPMILFHILGSLFVLVLFFHSVLLYRTIIMSMSTNLHFENSVFSPEGLDVVIYVCTVRPTSCKESGSPLTQLS